MVRATRIGLGASFWTALSLCAWRVWSGSGEAPGLGRIFSASSLVTLASLVGQAPGFLIPIAIAATLGVTAETDAFFLALAISSFVVSVTSAAAEHVAVPFFVAARRSERGFQRFLGEASGVTLVLPATFLIGLLPLVHAASWFQSGREALAEYLLWGLIPFVFLSAMASVWVGALNADRSYVAGALSPGLRSLVVLGLVVIAGDRWGVHGLVVGYGVGELCRALFLGARVASRYGVLPGVSRPSSEVRQFVRTAIAQVAGSAVLGLTPLIDRVMASTLGPGNVSILHYAERIWQVPLSLVASGFLVVSLAEWSHEVHAGQRPGDLSRNARKAAAYLGGLAVAVCAVLVVYRAAVVGVVFAGGSLSEWELSQIADALGVFLLGLPLYLVGLVYTRAFLVLGRSDWLFKVSIGQLLLKILLNLVLMRAWGVVGIALSSTAMFSLASLTLVAVYYWRLARHAG